MLRIAPAGIYRLTGAPSLKFTPHGDRMRVETLKTIPLPVSFLVVVSVTIALLIFFGAWAVSADAGDRDRVLAFAVPGGVSSLSVTPTQGSRIPGDAGADNTVEGLSAADTWWGGALLSACPLH